MVLATIHMICGCELLMGGHIPFLNMDYMIFGRRYDIDPLVFLHTGRYCKDSYFKNANSNYSRAKFPHYLCKYYIFKCKMITGLERVQYHMTE